jgi:signal transduction histidine kinase
MAEIAPGSWEDLGRALSHDVRGALDALVPALELAEAELDGGDPAQARHILRLTREGLIAARDDAAALARWAREAHELHPIEEVDLPAALRSLIGDIPHHGGPQIQARLDGAPARAALRWGGLAAALRPLLDNALAHHDRGPEGRLGLAATLEGDILTVTVEDDGPGLEHPERRALLLRRGRRDLRGMGLPWAFSACAAHGASLQLLPASPRGLKAVVRWPMSPLPR